jgi:hypothetical protein
MNDLLSQPTFFKPFSCNNIVKQAKNQPLPTYDAENGRRYTNISHQSYHSVKYVVDHNGNKLSTARNSEWMSDTKLVQRDVTLRSKTVTETSILTAKKNAACAQMRAVHLWFSGAYRHKSGLETSEHKDSLQQSIFERNRSISVCFHFFYTHYISSCKESSNF